MSYGSANVPGVALHATHQSTGITGTSTTATAFSGSGIALAAPGDTCINPTTGNVYKCTVGGTPAAAKWVYTGCIKGPQGAQGATGATGANGEAGAKGAKGDQGLFYGTCSTAAATAAKVVTLSGFSLVTGAVVAVKFTYGNTAANPTLNVNGTGAKSIAVYGTTAAGSGSWSDGEVVLFAYDGTRWVMNSGAVLGAGNGCEIYTGTYTGNGNSSFSLTFPKLPVYIAISGDGLPVASAVYAGAVLTPSASTSTYARLTINNTTISFPKSGEYNHPYNTTGKTYYYVAFAATNGTTFA